MRISKYWAKEKGLATDPAGDTYALTAWGGSLASAEDAARNAKARLARWTERIAGDRDIGEYEYGEGEIREELVEELRDADGELIGAITRNRYGALVLNAPGVFIADIDAPDASPLRRFFAWLSKPKDKAWHRARLAADAARRRDVTYVVYETHSGLRVFRADRDIAADSAEAAQELDALGSDRLYRALCRDQNCYRARLTPKPWRCGETRPPTRFPRESDAEERAFRDWLARYEAKSRDYAVCTARAVLGNARMTAAAERVLAVHDEMVLRPGKPLA